MLSKVIHSYSKNKGSSFKTSRKNERSSKVDAGKINFYDSSPDFMINNIDIINKIDDNSNGRNLLPKLKVNPPNDKYEREADHMAEQIMRMEERSPGRVMFTNALNTSQSQRKCNASVKEEDGKIQRKSLDLNLNPIIQRQVEAEEEEEELQMKQDSSQSFNGSTIPAAEVMPSGGGMQLPADTRDLFESRFGHDFSHVRIHHDSESGKAAKAIHARAFTLGNDIVFGAGQFNTGTHEGKKLLAHELTHVIQQGKSLQTVANKFEQPKQLPEQVVQKKNGPDKKPSTAGIKKALKAQKKVWDDLRAFFPDDIGKVAGTGFKESAGYLETDLTEDKAGPTTKSVPIINVGNDYLNEQDDEKRKEKLKVEVDKINQWRFDEAKLDNDDLKDQKLKNKLDDLNAEEKLAYIGKLKSKKYVKNDKVVEFLNSTIQSTPLEPGSTYKASGGFEVKVDNITITVLPDVFNSSEVTSGAVTKIRPVAGDDSWFRTPGWSGRGGKVTSMTFTPSVPDIKYTVQTHYSSGATPRSTSGYGVGTRTGDVTAQEKSLRSHEGAHGSEFISKIKSGAASIKYPVFTGQVGDAIGAFSPALADYQRGVRAFKAMVDRALREQVTDVDCVGKSIVTYHREHGTSTDVRCPH